MKKVVTVALFALSTFAVPTALVATPAIALTCGVDAPAGWERPGGFCDALKGTGSLSSPVEGAKEEDCEKYTYLLLKGVPLGEAIRVAEVDPCIP